MKGATRKGTPGRPISFARLASSVAVAARLLGEPHRTWCEVIDVHRRAVPWVGDFLARYIQEHGYTLSDSIPADLIQKGDQLRRRAARRRARKEVSPC